MALHFNAGQFQKGYDPERLQNWQTPKVVKTRPSRHEGFTQIIAKDNGHLLPSVPRSSRSPWGNYVGTWDLPRRIPGPKSTAPIARTEEALHNNIAFKEAADEIIYGHHKMRRPSRIQIRQCEFIEEVNRSGADNPTARPTQSIHELPGSVSSIKTPSDLGKDAGNDQGMQLQNRRMDSPISPMMKESPIYMAKEPSRPGSQVRSQNVKSASVLPPISESRNGLTTPQ